MKCSSWIGAAVLISIGAGSVYARTALSGLDSDTWFILNNGRYIWENGFPTVNPFAIHEGLPIVLSQSLTALLEYLVYRAFSYQGLVAWILVFTVLSAVMLLCLIRRCDKTGVWFIPIAVMVGYLYLCSPYFNNRPTLLTLSIVFAELWGLESFRQTGQRKYLLLLPVLSVLQANFHSSLYVVLFLPVLAYLSEDILHSLTVVFRRKRLKEKWDTIFEQKNGAARSVILTALVMPAAALLNPYGYKALTYLWDSYRTATEGSGISELQKPVIWNVLSIPWLCLVIVWCIWLFYRKFSGINGFHFFLFLGGALLYPMAYRNFWMFAVFAAPAVSDMLAEPVHLMERLQQALAELVSTGKYVLICLLLAPLFFLVPKPLEVSNSEATPVFAVSLLEQYFAGREKAELKIYTGFNNGAFLEWNGYRTYMDARPELYKEQGIFEEYKKLLSGELDYNAFLEKYDFDAIVTSDTRFLDMELYNHPEYTLCYKSDQYRVYVKK